MLIEIALAVASFILLYIAVRKPPGLPPGRWGLPFIGYVPMGGKYIDHMLMDFHKQFGDIYLWRFGTRLQVFIHDYHLLKQVNASPDFIDRPDMDVFKLHEEVPYGISGSNGAIWHTNRRFFLRHLRDLGMGKSHLVDAVHEQAEILLEELRKVDGKPGPIPDALSFVAMNVIWKMTANQHFAVDSPKHKYLQQLMAEANESLNDLAIADMMPWVRRVLPHFIFRRIFKEEKFNEVVDKFTEFFREMVDEHKAILDPDDPKDLIDAYLIEMNEWKEKKDAEGVRNDADLKFVLFDALFAGADTIHNTTKWILVYMAAYQEVQRKMQEEIDEVLPNGTLFSLEDRQKLHYTEAVINEVIRHSSVVSGGVPHAATRDTSIAGYKIPKGTMVSSSTASIHYDPRYWDKPDQFMPERWLNPDGKFVMQKEGYLPFGIGKRACPGESLARMEIEVYTTSVFRNFSISPPEGEKTDLLPDYNVMLLHQARKQDFVFTSRH